MLMDILAGLVSGLFLGTISLGGVIFILSTNRNMYDRLAKIIPQGISPTLVMLLAVIVVPPVWGMVGAVAGALYNIAIEASPNAGLGSPNFTFTLAILCLAGLAMLPTPLLILTKRRKWGLLFLIMNLLFAGIFGWILPLLANWR